MRDIINLLLVCTLRCALGILSLLGMCVILEYIGL